MSTKISIVNLTKNASNNTYMHILSFCTDEVTPDKVNSITKFLDANKAPGTINTNETHHFNI